MMTPREALDELRNDPDARWDTSNDEAFTVLERLVSKDEADTKFARSITPTELQRQARGRVPACTCGTAVACKVWGHS